MALFSYDTWGRPRADSSRAATIMAASQRDNKRILESRYQAAEEIAAAAPDCRHHVDMVIRIDRSRPEILISIAAVGLLGLVLGAIFEEQRTIYEICLVLFVTAIPVFLSTMGVMTVLRERYKNLWVSSMCSKTRITNRVYLGRVFNEHVRERKVGA